MHMSAAGRVTPRARYRFFRDLREDTRDLLLLALVDGRCERGIARSVWRRASLIPDLLRGFEETQHVGAGHAAAAPGEDVMERFGLPPSPAVARLLDGRVRLRRSGSCHARGGAGLP